LEDQGALFYDHGMDRRVGFTNPDSALFDGSDNIVVTYRSLAALTRATLQAAATATSTNILAVRKSETLVDGTPPDVPPVVLPTNSTPRPLDVSYEIQSLGLDARTFEDTL
jgi:hypothetical protein